MKVERIQYKCTLTPLTPIQIGNGNQIYPYDYVVKNGTYYRINLSEIIEKFPQNIKFKFIKLLENNNMIEIRSFIFENYKEEYGYIYKAPVEREFENKYLEKIKGANKKNDENSFIIEEFIGNVEAKYIPGSTIKGAIRSAFLFNEFDKKRDKYDFKKNLKYDKELNKKIEVTAKPFVLVDRYGKTLMGRNSKNEANKIEAKMLELTKLEPKFDPFKNFIVTDTQVTKENTVIKEISRLMPLGVNNKLSFGAEVLKSEYSDNEDVKLNFDIILKLIPSSLLKKDSLDKGIIKEDVYFEISDIAYALNKKAKKVLEKDLEFFKKNTKYREYEKISKELLEKLEKLEEKNEDRVEYKEALIRFGRGSGFNNTTFNLVNTNEEVYTRVVAGDCPVGWALITFEEV
ncbi:MAG: type III-A CRISPR-associated RAMP protein Csm5 [Fusobacterium perfoetens]|uniref:type III-A CRISPR-associated RAMP protein Csm5 n=1 Tax=Fusobacterium perfoetens TaxID=852 RepID=UPI0023F454D8|nr:type III-A CRISPR-associated RAMP protein Csm5 [Fusobacterium perfoetens]MCI6152328.1 type III-A CRISPR-associated RAMP protein Csm5 [Fusobacterium perfoetens]MDY3238186.1 type III-A CRISPR-associated RAMP protein Csm5 [Fusobacterium perfoetens]